MSSSSSFFKWILKDRSECISMLLVKRILQTSFVIDELFVFLWQGILGEVVGVVATDVIAIDPFNCC